MKRYLTNENNFTPKQSQSLSALVVCFIYLYVLFIPGRIKVYLSYTVEGLPTANIIWIIPLMFFIVYMLKRDKVYNHLIKYNILLLVGLFFCCLIIISGGFFAVSISQFITASLMFLVPILLLFLMSDLDYKDINRLIKFFVSLSLIYSILSILLSSNYGYIMGLVGNDAGVYQFQTQVRATMMFGSSIAVSYLFNLTLPLCFYLFYISKEKKWKVISALAIIFNIMATLVLLSRVASICAILIIIYYLVFINSKKNNLIKKTVFISLFLLAMIYVSTNFDLSRIFMGFSKSGNSVSDRLQAGNLGLNIFSQYPLLGSGMGRFFERVYSFEYITFDGITGLIDPHNIYSLILSELGILGFLCIFFIFMLLFKSFTYIKEKILRRTAYVILTAFLFDAMGGSHLFNNVNFAAVFWIYMGLFNAVSINDRKKKLKIN